jgi:hypothetical protein
LKLSGSLDLSQKTEAQLEAELADFWLRRGAIPLSGKQETRKKRRGLPDEAAL